MHAKRSPLHEAFDIVEETIAVGVQQLSVVRPRTSEQLLDEAAFEREELLPYWAELWPSALALGAAVERRGRLAGLRVVELGCGLGLPSVVAARAGASVMATDWAPDALAFTAENARRNGVEIETALLRWNEPGALVERGPWELVLASDVLYERRNVAPLLDLLPRVVADGGAVLLADPGRPHTGAFLDAAETRWRVEPVEPFEQPFVVELQRP